MVGELWAGSRFIWCVFVFPFLTSSIFLYSVPLPGYPKMATTFSMVEYISTDVTSGLSSGQSGQHLDQVSLLKPQLKRWLWNPSAVLSDTFSFCGEVCTGGCRNVLVGHVELQPYHINCFVRDVSRKCL